MAGSPRSDTPCEAADGEGRERGPSATPDASSTGGAESPGGRESAEGSHEPGGEDPWQIVRLALGSLAGESWRVKQALLWPSGAFRLYDNPEGKSFWELHSRTQTYTQYQSAIPFRPNTTNNTIHIVLVGNGGKIQDSLNVDVLVAHMQVFLGLNVVVRESPCALGPWAMQQESPDGMDQVSAQAVITQLRDAIDPRSVCTLGVALDDLYPPSTYDFVTGMTDADYRVGVYSFARYFNEGTYRDPHWLREALTLCFIKVLCRESLKLCGMGECCLVHCLMNPFPNGPPDAVRELPLQLCCICLRKLHWLTQADLLDRYAALPAVISTCFPEEAMWVWDRMVQLGQPTYYSLTSSHQKRRD